MAHSAYRYRSLMLLTALVVGWIVAPLIHQWEHATEWITEAHSHGDSDPRGSWEAGCQEDQLHLDECAAFHVKQSAEDREAPSAPTLPQRNQDWPLLTKSSLSFTESPYPARGPPI